MLRGIFLTIFLMFILSIVMACAPKKIGVKELIDRKTPMPLWQVLEHRKPGAGWVEYEDKRFEYFVDLEYIVWGQHLTNTLFVPVCPIKVAKYTVTNKESGKIVRNETLTPQFTPQETCPACHLK